MACDGCYGCYFCSDTEPRLALGALSIDSGPGASPGDAQPFAFCGHNIDLKQAVVSTTERFRHTLNETDRAFAEPDHDRPDYDVVLDIGGEKLSAHKELLMAHIPYFRAIFSHSFAESSSDMVSLVFDNCGLNPAYIRAIIRSLYDGHLDLSTDNANDVLCAAVYLNVEPLVEACCRFMFTRVRCDDALSLLGRFRSIGFRDDRLWRFIDANFVPISLSAAFKEMSVDELIEIIRRHSLRVDSEQQVLEAVDRWMAVDCARWPEGARLLNYVRISSLSIRHIDSAIESVEWVKANPDCVALLNEYKIPEHRAKRADRHCKDTVALLCVADTNRGSPNIPTRARSLRIFNVLTTEWTDLPMPFNLQFAIPSVAIGHKLYYLGEEGQVARVLDTATNKWSQLPSMPGGSKYLSSVGVIDDVIYVAGGQEEGRDDPTSTLISLDTKADNPVWEQRAPMTWPRIQAASCVHNGLLYVFGGEMHHRIFSRTNHAEFYRPDTDEWIPLSREAYWKSAVAADDRIYTRQSGKIFEAYMPATDTWTRLPNVVPESWNGNPEEQAVYAGGRLLSFSVYNGDMKAFDIEANEWKRELAVGDKDNESLSATWMVVPATTPLPIAAIEEPWFHYDNVHRP